MGDKHEPCKYERDIGQFAANIETVLSEIKKTNGHLEKQNGRIDSLESTRDKFSGGIKVMSVIVTLVIIIQASINIYNSINGGIQ